MDTPLTPENQNVLIEDALKSLPVASMPRDISADVMRRIQNVPAPRPFQLAWNDVAIALILSLSIAAMWFSLQSLPPIVIAQIHKEKILIYQYILVNGRWLIPLVSFGVAGFLAVLTIPYLRQELSKKSV